jgi:hypothetical protein
MDSDILDKFAGDRADLRSAFKDLYDDVVRDLIDEVRQAESLVYERSDRDVHAITVAAIHYARAITRTTPMREARITLARDRLDSAIAHWRSAREREEAAEEAKRQAELNAPRRRKRKSLAPTDP